MATPDQGPQIVQALQQYPQGPEPAIQMLIEASEAGDPRAQALAAFWLGQQGRWAEAANWAKQADEAGFVYIAWWVGHQLVGQADPTLRSLGAELVARGMTFAGGVEPFSPAQQLAGQGLTAEALKVLDAALDPPAPWKHKLAETVTEADAHLEQIRHAEVTATAERDRVTGELASVVATGRAELESIQRLGKEVGEIAHDRAADYLTKGYGKEADSVQKRADIATGLSMLLAIGIAIAAIVVASDLPADDTLSDALEKAAFSLPLLALNAYLARLASTFREEALRWRHIKLQIQTAHPFLGALDEGQRKETLALLATRFFPGQPMPFTGQATEPPDVSAAVGAALQRQPLATRVPEEQLTPAAPPSNPSSASPPA